MICFLSYGRLKIGDKDSAKKERTKARMLLGRNSLANYIVCFKIRLNVALFPALKCAVAASNMEILALK